jgi:uncharacterized membrane protein YjjB (DUF3815 family)
MAVLLPALRELALAFVATLGFGLLFNVPRRALLACGLTGAIGRVVRALVEGLGASDVGGTFLGAVAVALVGYGLARLYRVPRTIFTITGVIPMVPGVPAFSTMLQLAAGDIQQGIASAVQTALITGALAMGLTVVRVASHVPPRPYDTS